MALHHNPRIVTEGLVLLLDASDPASYQEGSTIWYDMSGNNNHASLSTPFDAEYAFNNTGSNKYFESRPSEQLNEIDEADGSVWEIPHSTSLSPTTGWTVAGFMNVVGSQSGNGTGWFHKAGLNDERGIHLEPIDTRFRINGASNWSHVAPNISAYHNNWHYYTITYTAGGTYGTDPGNLSFYIDGILLLEANDFIPAVDSTTKISLGRRNGHYKHYLNGDVSNYHYYNRALSSEEVLQNFQTLQKRFV